MKIQVATLVISLIYSLSIAAHAVDKITIQGSVYDKTSDTQLFVVDAKLLSVQDSAIVAKTKAVGEYDGPVRGEFAREMEVDMCNSLLCRVLKWCHNIERNTNATEYRFIENA